MEKVKNLFKKASGMIGFIVFFGCMVVFVVLLVYISSESQLNQALVRDFFDALNKNDVEEAMNYLEDKKLLDNYKEEIRKYKIKYKIEDMEFDYEQDDVNINVTYKKYMYEKGNEDFYIVEEKVEKFHLVDKKGKYLIKDIITLEKKRNIVEKRPL